ncbi:hypothetical protein [Pseudorhodoferax sp. Leaf265]|uniref:hypothetical protein n=1 Tax=Pseudorhodoferax sp. Leaf265 TaxID=1736315 RepID=UPI0012E8805E|nr:hypothetical protein [Pseudorhodoferax sp. Leaf265]
MTATFLDSDGTASVFWGGADSGTMPRWRAASLAPGASSPGPTVEIALAQGNWWTQTADLGNKRFAVIETLTSKWESRVVDLSAPSSPSVSPRVVLDVGYPAQMVTTQFDGAYVVGTNVSLGPIDMGGGITAQGTPIELPSNLSRPTWGRVERLWGAASAWWGFNATSTTDTQQNVYLGLVDLASGAVRRTEDRRPIPWVDNGSNYYACRPNREPYIEVSDYGQGRAVIGWIQRKLASNRGCDIVADGATLTGPSANAAGGPVLGGSVSGPVVLWQESALGATDHTPGPSRIVWRSQDAQTGTWGATNELSFHPHAYITGRTSAPQGLIAIAWAGCPDHTSSRCTNYLTKFVRGQWQTVSLGAAGPFSPFYTQVAINIHGDAIAVWSFSAADRCPEGVTARCARVYAQRF